MILNPNLHAVTEYVRKLLGDEKAALHYETIQRSLIGLTTKNDTLKFMEMILSIYKIGYMKAVTDYQEKLKDYGIGVNVVPFTMGQKKEQIGSFDYKIT